MDIKKLNPFAAIAAIAFLVGAMFAPATHAAVAGNDGAHGQSSYQAEQGWDTGEDDADEDDDEEGTQQPGW